MADVSNQRLATLTQTASQTPQFQPNSDPVQAGLSAVQMGLDFYAKGKAQEQLDTMAQQQAKRNQDLSAGALELVQGRQRLASQGASSLDIEKFQKRILSRYDSATAFEVLSMGNKVSKGSLSQSIGEAEERADARNMLETQAAQLNGLLPMNLPANPTDEELEAFVLRGEAEKAWYANKSMKANAEMSVLNTAEAKRKVNVRETGAMVNRFVGAQATSLLDEALQVTDLTNPTAKKELVNMLSGELLKIPELVSNFAATRNLTLTKAERDDLSSQITSQLQGAIDFITSDNSSKIDKNTMSILSNKVLFEGLASEDPNVRNSAAATIGNLANGLPADPAALKNLENLTMVSIASGNLWRDAANEDNIAFGKAAMNAGLSMIPLTFKSEDQGGYAYDTVVNNFTGSPEKLSNPDQQRVMVKIVEGIGEAGDALNIKPESRGTLGQMLRDVMEPKLIRTYSSFMEEGTALEPMSASNRNSMQAPTFTARGGDRYSINPDTLEVRPIDAGAQMSPKARNLNKLMRDTLKAYEALGVDTEPFKTDVRNTFGIKDGSEQDGN